MGSVGMARRPAGETIECTSLAHAAVRRCRS
jgi:hypothetical protein